MGKNSLTETYHSPDQTIRAVSEVDVTGSARRAQYVGRTSVASQLHVRQVHPLLWEYLRQHAPKTELGHVDRSVLQFDTEYHVTPDSTTIDAVTIYGTSEQKRLAESR